MNTGRSNRWRRIFHWPLFCILGVVHIVALPPLLSEQSDDRVSLLAGLAYLALAALDWRVRDRGQAVGSQSGRVRS